MVRPCGPSLEWKRPLPLAVSVWDTETGHVGTRPGCGWLRLCGIPALFPGTERYLPKEILFLSDKGFFLNGAMQDTALSLPNV